MTGPFPLKTVPPVSRLWKAALPTFGVFISKNVVGLNVLTSTVSEKVRLSIPGPISIENRSRVGAVLSLM